MRDKGPKIQFSMKKQTNEDVFEQFAFESVPDNFTSTELKKEKRQKTLEQRVKFIDEIRKQQEVELAERKAIAAEFEATLKKDQQIEQNQKANPFGASARNTKDQRGIAGSPILNKEKFGPGVKRGLTQTKSPKTKNN